MPKVVLTSKVAAPPDQLWQVVRGFGTVSQWNPLVEQVVAAGENVGSKRELEIKGTGRFVERLDARDDGARSYTYSIVDSPLPVGECTVEIRVSDNGDGTSTIEWRSDFIPEPAKEFTAVRAFQRIYQEALDNLQAQFSHMMGNGLS